MKEPIIQMEMGDWLLLEGQMAMLSEDSSRSSWGSTLSKALKESNIPMELEEWLILEGQMAKTLEDSPRYSDDLILSQALNESNIPMQLEEWLILESQMAKSSGDSPRSSNDLLEVGLLRKPDSSTKCGKLGKLDDSRRFEESRETYLEIGDPSDSTSTVLICGQCKQVMCKDCATKHTSMTVSRSHRMCRIGKQFDFGEFMRTSVDSCDLHEGRMTQIFCQTCRTVGCLACLKLHQNHACRSLLRAEDELRLELTRMSLVPN